MALYGTVPPFLDPGIPIEQGKHSRVSQQKRANTIATHMWLRSCLATIQTQGLQRFSTTDCIIAAKSHTPNLRGNRKCGQSPEAFPNFKKMSNLRHVFPRKCLVFHAPGPGAQGPRDPSKPPLLRRNLLPWRWLSVGPRDAGSAARSWVKHVLGKPQKGWTLVKSFQNSGKLYRVPLGVPI